MVSSVADAETMAPPRSLGRKLGFLVLLVVLSLAALGAGLAAAMGPDRLIALVTGAEMPPPPVAEENDAHADKAGDKGGDGAGGHAPAAPMLVALPFKEIIVNITSITTTGRRTSRFLKLNVALVYDKSVPGAENIETRQLHMRDSFQDYLRLLTEHDLQGSLGLVRLKSELLRRARAVSGSDAPTELLVSDLIIQ